MLPPTPTLIDRRIEALDGLSVDIFTNGRWSRYAVISRKEGGVLVCAGSFSHYLWDPWSALEKAGPFHCLSWLHAEELTGTFLMGAVQCAFLTFCNKQLAAQALGGVVVPPKLIGFLSVQLQWVPGAHTSQDDSHLRSHTRLYGSFSERIQCLRIGTHPV